MFLEIMDKFKSVHFYNISVRSWRGWWCSDGVPTFVRVTPVDIFNATPGHFSSRVRADKTRHLKHKCDAVSGPKPNQTNSTASSQHETEPKETANINSAD